jgi:hypothetical protein
VRRSETWTDAGQRILTASLSLSDRRHAAALADACPVASHLPQFRCSGPAPLHDEFRRSRESDRLLLWLLRAVPASEHREVPSPAPDDRTRHGRHDAVPLPRRQPGDGQAEHDSVQDGGVTRSVDSVLGRSGAHSRCGEWNRRTQRTFTDADLCVVLPVFALPTVAPHPSPRPQPSGP